MKNLILGMGNPILTDDGVGLHVARALAARFPSMDVRTTTMIGLDLLDLVCGYDRVFVVDAIQTGRHPPGTVEKMGAAEGVLHLFSSHGLHFFEILQLGRDLGHKVPVVGGIYGVEIGAEPPFGEHLSPALAGRKTAIVREIGEDIARVLGKNAG